MGAGITCFRVCMSQDAPPACTECHSAAIGIVVEGGSVELFWGRVSKVVFAGGYRHGFTAVPGRGVGACLHVVWAPWATQSERE